MIKQLNGDSCHLLLAQEAVPQYAFSAAADYAPWRETVSAKLSELLGWNSMEKNICPLNVEIEEDRTFDGYRRIRFTFESERGCVIPCYLLIPSTGKAKYPVAITLQGHSTGVHNSINEPKSPQDEVYLQKYGPIGLQGVENGFASLCIEQRGMGELRSPLYPGPGGVHACAVTALTALNLGRTIIGERVWDVHRSIDALAEFAGLGLDLDKILITGNSGGGMISYYAACMEPRIRYSAPSCFFCAYKDSIMEHHHCVCNFIPDINQWVDIGDLSCMIAPRPLSIFTGRLDPDFPVEGAEKAFETVKAIYAAAGAPESCSLTVTPKAHFWCRDIVWPTIMDVTTRLGWWEE